MTLGTFGVTRLQYAFFGLGMACLIGSIFVDSTLRLGILFSSGVMTFFSLHIVCQVLSKDLESLARLSEIHDGDGNNHAQGNGEGQQ